MDDALMMALLNLKILSCKVSCRILTRMICFNSFAYYRLLCKKTKIS
jgi:hypothetical protein